MESKEPNHTKLQELLGDSFNRANKDGTVSTVSFSSWYKEFAPKGEFVCLYFSAHWAPPCRLFS